MNNSKQPFVSLIIPVYNVARFLPRLFQCIDNQDYPNFEVIFVNDGSTDNSRDLVEEFCAKDLKKFKLIDKINGGLNPARKTGLDNAKYELIMFSDSDDYFDFNYISSFVSALDDNIDIVCAPIITEDENGKLISILNPATKEVEIWDKEEALLKLFRDLEISNYMPNKLFRKQALENVDFSYRKPFEDYTSTHLTFYNSRKIKKIDVASYHYIKRTGTLSNKSLASYLSGIDALLMRRTWVLDTYASNDALLFLNDDALFDRFIQTIKSYKIKRSNAYYRKLKVIYVYNKRKRKLNKYCKRNLPLYFLSPSLFWAINKVIGS